jgi:molecular chaperone IbpA
MGRPDGGGTSENSGRKKLCAAGIDGGKHASQLIVAGRHARVRWDIEGAGSAPALLMPRSLHTEDLDMRTSLDFTPYRRSTVGFDRLFDLLETGLRTDAAESYPSFDIVREGEDSYRITLAVAGFRPDEIEIVAQQHQLTVTGKRAEDKQQGAYLHRGIATRAFERRFQLADFIEAGDARFENGLLSIELRRVVPEAMKPRKIAIGGTPANDRIAAPSEDRQAA